MLLANGIKHIENSFESNAYCIVTWNGKNAPNIFSDSPYVLLRPTQKIYIYFVSFEMICKQIVA